MKHRVTAREWTLHVEDAPPVEGHTSSLNVAAVVPDRVVINEYPTGVIAQVEGPRVRKNGEPGATHVVVKVLIEQLDGSWQRHPQAPDWLAEVYRQVSA